jgi:hypothetical protein
VASAVIPGERHEKKGSRLRRAEAGLLFLGEQPRGSLVGNSIGNVLPLRVSLVYQLEFPRPIPALQLLFADDGFVNAIQELEPDQCFDAVFSREARNQIGIMLVHSTMQIIGYANLKPAIASTGKHVDKVQSVLPRIAPLSAGRVGTGCGSPA